MTSRWLVDGVLQWIRSDDALSLTSRLGLPSNSQRVRLALRDAYLIDAAARVAGGPWAKSKNLLAGIRRFANAKWARWTARPELAGNASEFDMAIFQSFQHTYVDAKHGSATSEHLAG